MGRNRKVNTGHSSQFQREVEGKKQTEISCQGDIFAIGFVAMTNKHVVGVDVGTGSLRAAVFTTKGEMLGHASANLNEWSEASGIYEQRLAILLSCTVHIPFATPPPSSACVIAHNFATAVLPSSPWPPPAQLGSAVGCLRELRQGGEAETLNPKP
jgi:D-ribulokinase